MTIVDTCVLSSLAKIDRLDLLRKSFENIIVAPSVVNEIERVGEAKFVKKIKDRSNVIIISKIQCSFLT